MIDKKRRDITLGEMQDECRRFESPLCGGKACAYVDLCNQMKSGYTPHAWDLSDPPRFTEAQMAFWRGLHAIGINFVMLADDGLLLRMAESRQADNCTMIAVLIEIKLGLSKGEELDLAELLGKDGADEKA